MDLTRSLMALAASVTADGGDELVRVLRPMLREAAPFDLGEIAVSQPLGFKRWTLTEDDDPVVAEDFLLHVTARKDVVRLDDRPQAEAFRRTLARMEAGGLRSLLALPLGLAGGLEGAIVLGRRYGWAFVGAPLHDLVPIASMAGLGLDRAAALARLQAEAEAARGQVQRAAPALAEREVLAARVRELEASLAEVRASRDSLLAKLQRQRADLQAVKAAPEPLRRPAGRRRAETPRLREVPKN